jgi:ribosomal protein S27AE
MSIRDLLWRKILRSQLGGLAAGAVVLVVLAVLPGDAPRMLWIPLAFGAFAVPYGILTARIECPRCGYPFFLSSLFRIRLGAVKYRTNHCPHCGVHLDAEVEAAPADAPSRPSGYTSRSEPHADRR